MSETSFNTTLALLPFGKRYVKIKKNQRTKASTRRGISPAHFSFCQQWPALVMHVGLKKRAGSGLLIDSWRTKRRMPALIDNRTWSLCPRETGGFIIGFLDHHPVVSPKSTVCSLSISNS